ncbi:MAG: hypothetical protein R3B46_08120 [Phycisphaerales bacterium]|nr:hypothetical protein [Phycisphaerales bacterium]
MRHGRIDRCAGAWMALVALLLSACSGGGGGEATPGAITDKSADLRDRMASVERTDEFVAEGALDPSGARESLKRVVWERSAPTQLRAGAIAQLLKDEANLADTRRMFALMLPTEPDQGIVTVMGDAAAERGWTDLGPALVRRWSRAAALSDYKIKKDAPERTALAKLFPGCAPSEVVFDVFMDRLGGEGAGGNEGLRERDRVEAWGLLMALEPDEARLLERLTHESVPDDALTQSVVWSARELKAVPRTGEQLAWVRRLGEGRHAEFRSRAASVVAGLGAEQMRGWALRHMAGVVYASERHPEWLTMSRSALLGEAGRRLKGRTVYRREMAGTLTGETLGDDGDKLSWGDALLLMVAIDCVDDQGVAGALFVSAERDRRDTTTEYGGLIDWSAPRGFAATTYPPRPTERYGDDRFVASQEMLDAGDASVLFFHFHASDYANRRYAGPSDGDLEYAKRQGRCGLVYTFVSPNKMNADYYTPDGAVVDLGAVERTDGGG